MNTFGQNLMEAIESRGLSLEEVAQASGLDILYLKALERGDHAALPEDESVTECLQAFARLVDVDPDEVIDAYLREHENDRRTAPTDVEVAIVRDAPQVPDVVMQRPASRPARWPGLFVFGAAALVLAAAGFVWFQFSGQDEPAPADLVSRSEVPSEVPMVPENTPETPDVQPTLVKPSEPTAPVPPTGNAMLPSGLVIPHLGVGTGVVNHQLIGEAERFAEGTQVWFWNWVEGATSGQTIHHVWLHEGREMLSVPLRLGGVRWRTQSNKNLHLGTTGHWAVEARDEAGRVLARQDFQCFSPAAG